MLANPQNQGGYAPNQQNHGAHAPNQQSHGGYAPPPDMNVSVKYQPQ